MVATDFQTFLPAMYSENNVLTKHKTDPGLAESLYAHLNLRPEITRHCTTNRVSFSASVLRPV